ncbi:unnamed protein product [Sphagnum balticum]
METSVISRCGSLVSHQLSTHPASFFRNSSNTSSGRHNQQQQQKERSRVGVVPVISATAATPNTHGAKLSKRSPRPENVDGDFYVDHACIDCNVCRMMTPTVYSRLGQQSIVYNQPSSDEERLSALQALLCCPTASIHTREPPTDIKRAHDSFPLAIDPNTIEGVYHCGYHTEASYGATSYFIVRPGGNILVDSPRYSVQLAKRMEAMGGVRYMFLTHRDDVADHEKWQEHFKCERILHEREVTWSTAEVETKLQGEGPWSLEPDIELIFNPGHTEACVSLWYKTKGALFTGDHLVGNGKELMMDRVHNWYSVRLQIESIRALLPYDFTWVLPGHGYMHHFNTVEEKNVALRKLIAKEESM